MRNHWWSLGECENVDNLKCRDDKRRKKKSRRKTQLQSLRFLKLKIILWTEKIERKGKFSHTCFQTNQRNFQMAQKSWNFIGCWNLRDKIPGVKNSIRGGRRFAFCNFLRFCVFVARPVAVHGVPGCEEATRRRPQTQTDTRCVVRMREYLLVADRKPGRVFWVFWSIGFGGSWISLSFLHVCLGLVLINAASRKVNCGRAEDSPPYWHTDVYTDILTCTHQSAVTNLQIWQF